MNSDPEVMEFFPKLYDLQQTVDIINRIEGALDELDFGLWALELKKTNEFVGMVGLCRPRFEAHFTPCVEVGWRVARHHWNQGYATEAAQESLKDGFQRIGLTEIVAMTAAGNQRSMRVMEKLHMTRDPADDFPHPLLEDGHPLQLHVLYRLTGESFRHHMR
jgi:RimJ/RimL family protein N-acetyltransferase